jgi:class 3 adenylate cyclase
LGPGTLLAFAAGRYYHPRIEERALLFMDMRASTAIAERVGELRILDLLNRFVADVSLAVAEAGGEIHQYVGDEVIATWRLAPGANQLDCVRACFGAFDRIDAQRSAYERDFGLVPDFRAGLHCGPVAVGELGYLKKEIALIGDTMNAAARIVEACRETENRVLASAALLDRLAALPPGVTRRRLGELALRGKERPLELCALEADGDRALNRLARRDGRLLVALSGRTVIERRLSHVLRSFSSRPLDAYFPPILLKNSEIGPPRKSRFRGRRVISADSPHRRAYRSVAQAKPVGRPTP